MVLLWAQKLIQWSIRTTQSWICGNCFHQAHSSGFQWQLSIIKLCWLVVKRLEQYPWIIQINLLRGIKQTWHGYFLLPPMRNRRCSPVVVSHNRNLIVAGGNKGLLDYSVEVLDSESEQWMLASQLPLSCSSSPNIVYKECWYFFREADNSVIYTNLSNIVDSAIDQSENRVIESGLESGYNSLSCSQDSQPATSQSPNNLLLDWHIYCALPFTPTQISTIQGCLIAFSNHEDSSSHLAVYGYTSESNNWTHLGNLPALCSNASFIASPSKLFVVGGDTSSSTSAAQYSNKMFCASIRDPS